MWGSILWKGFGEMPSYWKLVEELTRLWKRTSQKSLKVLSIIEKRNHGKGVWETFSLIFSGKRVLITGGGQGIGRKMVEDFLSSGAGVIVWERSSKNLEQLKKDFPSSKLVTTQVDVSLQESCEKAAGSLKEPIDFLINNAGILRDRSLAKMTWEEYSSVIQTNLNGVFLAVKSLLSRFNPELSSAKRIVNLSSVVALYGNFGQSNYVAAKAGVIGFTKVWARELGKKGFTVNSIAPGFIDTDILKDMPQKVKDSLIAKISVGRIGRVEDISQTCLFLCF